MPLTSGAALAKFFVFNPTISKKETTEHENVLYYWPPSTVCDRQMIDVGLARGLITFARTFSPDKPIELMQTEKHQQVFHEHEPDFWFVMVCTRPKRETGRKDKDQDPRELEHRILLGVLQRLCRMLKLLQGSLAALLSEGIPAVSQALAAYFDVALPLLTATTLSTADMFDTVDGIQYLATDRLSFLKMQSFLNKVETEFEGRVVASMVLVDDYLLFSSLPQNDTRCLYRFLTRRRQRAKGEKPNLQRGDSVLFLSTLQPDAETLRGFLTVEEDSSGQRTPAPIRIFMGDLPGPLQSLYLVVWQHQLPQPPAALFAFLVTEHHAKALRFHKELDTFACANIGSTVLDILQKVSRPPEPEDYQYVYFNHMNLALKSNLRKPGTLVGSAPNAISTADVPELLGSIEAMHADFAQSTTLKEVVMKTKRNEQWVVGRRWGHREFYAFFDAKRTLADVTEELRTINKQFFLNSFVDY